MPNYLKETHDELIKIFNAPPIKRQPFQQPTGRMIRPPQNMPTMPKNGLRVPQAAPTSEEQPQNLQQEYPFAMGE